MRDFPWFGPCIEHDSKNIVELVEKNYLSAHFLLIMNDIYTKLCLECNLKLEIRKMKICTLKDDLICSMKVITEETPTYPNGILDQLALASK